MNNLGKELSKGAHPRVPKSSLFCHSPPPVHDKGQIDLIQLKYPLHDFYLNLLRICFASHPLSSYPYLLLIRTYHKESFPKKLSNIPFVIAPILLVINSPLLVHWQYLPKWSFSPSPIPSHQKFFINFFILYLQLLSTQLLHFKISDTKIKTETAQINNYYWKRTYHIGLLQIYIVRQVKRVIWSVLRGMRINFTLEYGEKDITM